jgi:hypothetical protein
LVEQNNAVVVRIKKLAMPRRQTGTRPHAKAAQTLPSAIGHNRDPKLAASGAFEALEI